GSAAHPGLPLTAQAQHQTIFAGGGNATLTNGDVAGTALALGYKWHPSDRVGFSLRAGLVWDRQADISIGFNQIDIETQNDAFSREDWRHLTTDFRVHLYPILFEAAAAPQRIGVAFGAGTRYRSDDIDGVRFKGTDLGLLAGLDYVITIDRMEVGVEAAFQAYPARSPDIGHMRSVGVQLGYRF
ncbi:MAG: hypothetical protein AAF970_18325, partial [Bacteroidota bacterium]